MMIFRNAWMCGTTSFINSEFSANENYWLWFDECRDFLNNSVQYSVSLARCFWYFDMLYGFCHILKKNIKELYSSLIWDTFIVFIMIIGGLISVACSKPSIQSDFVWFPQKNDCWLETIISLGLAWYTSCRYMTYITLSFVKITICLY